MNPILRQMLLEPEGIVRRGLVGSYKFDDGQGQILTDSSSYGNHGQLGSTTAVDTNDPTWTGGGLSFTTDDYVKLPYMINAEQDFTVYLVANVGASVPSGTEFMFSFGNSGVSVPFVYILRETTGDIKGSIRNDAVAQVVSVMPSNEVSSGIRLLALKRSSSKLIIKDILSGKTAQVGCPTPPITLNMGSIGCFRYGTNINSFSNQPEYFASFHTCATTDAEDKRNMRAIKRELLKRGVILGSKNEFYADFVGKVAGSTVENANIGYRNNGTVSGNTSLGTPVSLGSLTEGTQSYYTNTMTLDGATYPIAVTNVGGIGQDMRSFNIIRDIEDKGVVIPGVSVAEKVTWIIDNVGNITANWHGRGTSPTGNLASTKLWNAQALSWTAVAITQTTGTISKVVYPVTTNIPLHIDSNGIFHLIAYAEPSDGVTASTIYTDTCNLLITLKAGVVLV